MLTKLDLINFKSFSNLDNLEFKPITILCGSNSCGKSSILHSLLLQKQTKESKAPNQLLLLNGKYIHLGDFENIVHGSDKNIETTIKYEYTTSRKHTYSTNARGDFRALFFTELKRFVTKETRSNREVKNYKIITEYSFRSVEKRRGYIKIAEITKSITKIILELNNGECVDGPVVEIKKSGSTYKLKWKNLEPSEIGFFTKKENIILIDHGEIDSVSVTFEGLCPIIQFDYSSKQLSSDKEKLIDPFSAARFLHSIHNYINVENKELSYIGPLREEPSRRYIYENEILDIGVKGENAAYIYQTEQDTTINDHFVYNESDDSYELKDASSLQTLLTDWLQLMGINNFTHNHEGEMIRLKMSANSCTETMVNIADVGFGVSQIFPILLEGLRIKKNASLILEQPEIHLHPALQMKMADYLITLALSKKNVIVETHSDHIINRLVRRIVEDSKFNLNELIAIYFVKNTHDGAMLEPIQIDPTRGIINWPKGFFDQTATEQELILKAGINKRMKNKGI